MCFRLPARAPRGDVTKAAVAAPVEVARIEQIPPGRSLAFDLGPCRIALFNVAGALFALEDSCIRCAGSTAAGTLDAFDVVCAGCGWRYDVRTGAVSTMSRLRLDRFDVQLRGSTVIVLNPFA